MPKQTDLLRVPAQGMTNLTILSGRVVGCYTHWWHGRTAPCLAPKCEACDNNKRRDWKGYLCCQRASTKEIIMVEVTPGAMRVLHDKYRQLRTLRGCTLHLTRKGETKLGKMHAQVIAPRGSTDGLPKAISQTKFLERMWRLDHCPDQPCASDEIISMEASEHLDPTRIKRA